MACIVVAVLVSIISLTCGDPNPRWYMIETKNYVHYVRQNKQRFPGDDYDDIDKDGKSANNEFNCPNICGEAGSTILDSQRGCEAFDEEGYCTKEQKEKEAKFENKLEKKKKSEGHRIVKGVDVKEYIPWMVLIKVTGKHGGDLMCGGSLINSRFVLTAAHCVCNSLELCSNEVGRMNRGSGPMAVKEGIKISNHIQVFIGKAAKLSGGSEKIMEDAQKSTPFKAESVYFHPELGENENHPNTPDLMLIKMDRPVKFITNKIGPVCLPNKETMKDVPPCSDNSFGQTGGCATVAGWGHRGAKTDRGLYRCITDTSLAAPAKATECSKSSYRVNGIKFQQGQCSKLDIPPKQLPKKCQEFHREMRFRFRYRKELNETYESTNYDLLTKNSPVILKYGKRGKTVLCGKINFENERRDPDFSGWCPTNSSGSGKRILSYGFCPKSCEPEAGTEIQQLNVNILTDLECETIAHPETMLDTENEFCAGKKQPTPDRELVFRRRRKKKTTKKEFQLLQDKNPKGPKQTKYSYRNTRRGKRSSLDLGVDYKYNWFLGGGDSCQGDSGGPLWRIVNDEGKRKAIQIGVVSRGQICAGFNQPGIYVKIKNYFNWIKEIVENNGDIEEFCPAKKPTYH